MVLAHKNEGKGRLGLARPSEMKRCFNSLLNQWTELGEKSSQKRGRANR